MRIKMLLRSILGFLGISDSVTYRWRSLTPAGRKINQRLAEEHRRLKGMYSQFLKPGDLCFDIGANIGTYTNALLKLGVRVVAVEPQQACVDMLRAQFGFHKRVQIVPMGLAEKDGQVEFLVSSNDQISSMSQEWTAALRNRGGKFAQAEWSKKVVVPVTTLDALISQYGTPAFCKIDVEGFEYEVLKGLSRPIQALSFEFTPEYMQPTLNCVDYLARLGNYQFNYSLEGTMQFALPAWVTAPTMTDNLKDLASTHRSGDVYARLAEIPD